MTAEKLPLPALINKRAGSGHLFFFFVFFLSCRTLITKAVLHFPACSCLSVPVTGSFTLPTPLTVAQIFLFQKTKSLDSGPKPCKSAAQQLTASLSELLCRSSSDVRLLDIQRTNRKGVMKGSVKSRGGG